VRGTHGVEVELFHQADVGFHGGAADGLTGQVVVVVAVDALDHDGFAVDEQLAVTDLDLSEAEAAGGALFALRGGQGDDQGVQMGGLSGPQERLGDGVLQIELGA